MNTRTFAPNYCNYEVGIDSVTIIVMLKNGSLLGAFMCILPTEGLNVRYSVCNHMYNDILIKLFVLGKHKPHAMPSVLGKKLKFNKLALKVKGQS